MGGAMNKLFNLVVLISIVAIASGCASITGSPNQSVSVQTREQTGKEVTGAACELTNSKGTWFVTTPGSVSIHRSNDDMQATCRKEGLEPGRAAIVSDTKGSMFGNILLGGGIGAIVDHNNGSAYEYPTLIQIVMGGFAKIEAPKQNPPPPDSTVPANSQAVSQSQTSPAPSIPPPGIQPAPVNLVPPESKEGRLR